MVDMQTIPLLEETLRIQKEIRKKQEELIALRRAHPPETVADHILHDWDGGEVKLSELFGDKRDLLVIHNMGKRCVYCTLWADGFNGIHQHLSDRAGFVVVSPDKPDVQKAFAESRGWGFKMLSGADSDFIGKMGFIDKEDGSYWPGVSSFRKLDDGTIQRMSADIFGPGDHYCGVWHLMDLLADGPKDWEPQYKY